MKSCFLKHSLMTIGDFRFNMGDRISKTELITQYVKAFVVDKNLYQHHNPQRMDQTYSNLMHQSNMVGCYKSSSEVRRRFRNACQSCLLDRPTTVMLIVLCPLCFSKRLTVVSVKNISDLASTMPCFFLIFQLQQLTFPLFSVVSEGYVTVKSEECCRLLTILRQNLVAIFPSFFLFFYPVPRPIAHRHRHIAIQYDRHSCR